MNVLDDVVDLGLPPRLAVSDQHKLTDHQDLRAFRPVAPPTALSSCGSRWGGGTIL